MVEEITFAKWFEHQYLEWQASTESRQTIDDFAKWLGFKRPTVNLWMNGNTTPGRASADRLALKLGCDVYKLLGIPPSDLRLVNVEVNWPTLSDELRSRIAEQVERYLKEHPQDYKPEG